MAGLTREQRAEREAANAAETPKDDDGLVAMEKDGETIRVHPTCVQSHKLAHWKLKEQA